MWPTRNMESAQVVSAHRVKTWFWDLQDRKVSVSLQWFRPLRLHDYVSFSFQWNIYLKKSSLFWLSHRINGFFHTLTRKTKGSKGDLGVERKSCSQVRSVVPWPLPSCHHNVWIGFELEFPGYYDIQLAFLKTKAFPQQHLPNYGTTIPENDPLNRWSRTSMAVQWLGLCAPNAGSTVLIPGWGTKIPHAARCGQ